MRFRRRSPKTPELRLAGWPPSSRPSTIDGLHEEDLGLLNGLLPWRSFTTDGHGRRFGDRAWAGKRELPDPIPDPRIELMDERFALAETSVLEIGCFEGSHTVALCDRAGHVTAVDSRIENVAKTAVRCALFDVQPRILLRDVDRRGSLDDLDVDYVHHVGVLYHLEDPVGHLAELGHVARRGVMLDTHVAPADDATEQYGSGGNDYRYRRYGEGGRADVFSGMTGHAKWLTLDGLRAALTAAGFPEIDVHEERAERNGPRVLLFAAR
jgi:SAM-dependent methyltransferase